jgi:hypothetical protein
MEPPAKRVKREPPAKRVKQEPEELEQDAAFDAAFAASQLSAVAWTQITTSARSAANAVTADAGAIAALPKWQTARRMRTIRTERWRFFKLCITLLPEKTSAYMPLMVREFVEEEGRLPTSSDVCDSVPIGRWCQKIRKLYRDRTLAEQLEKEMSAIPRWTWDYNAEAIEEVKDFLHLHNRMPLQGEMINGWPIGYWCWRQSPKTAVGQRLAAIPGWEWCRASE